MRLAVFVASALALFAPFSIRAQGPPPARAAAAGQAGPGRITGRVADAAGQPLHSVAVTIRSAADSAFVTGELTDKTGAFGIDGLPLGAYRLRVSLIGYLPRNSEVIDLTQAAPAVDLGTIALQVAPVQLQGIEAVADRGAVVVEADRTVYNTKSMPAATGNAVDVLRAVPELEVDVNDNIKLRGNQTVAIHMNGRPAPLRGEQLTNFLKQLPSDRIDRVEVMPNPSAKHDPEGMGGIVNIVLKENLDLGLSGSVSANASTRNRQYFNGRLNYQRGRLTLFAGTGISTYQNDGTNYDLRENLITQPVTFIEQNGAFNDQSLGGNADWTVEFKVGTRSHLWSNAWIYWSDSNNTGRTRYGILDPEMTPFDRYDRTNDTGYFWGTPTSWLATFRSFSSRRRNCVSTAGTRVATTITRRAARSSRSWPRARRSNCRSS